MKKFLLILTIILFLSGCISSATPTGLEPNKVYENQEDIIMSYQFWNEQPFSIYNETIINNTGLLDCDITTYSHDIGNLTIKIRTDGEVIYDETFNNSRTTLVVPVLKNTTLETYSNGYYESEIAPVGDYYTLICVYYY